jgi:hypothetical protein
MLSQSFERELIIFQMLNDEVVLFSRKLASRHLLHNSAVQTWPLVDYFCFITPALAAALGSISIKELLASDRTYSF